MVGGKRKVNNKSRFVFLFMIWISIFVIGFVNKTFQNDTFYTIKIGELIFNNGIDMMDHFSFHSGLMYTYPHWLYDCLIYGIYYLFGYGGVYISSIVFLIVLLFIVFKTSRKISNNYSISAFATIICALAISGFATARAQLISFILFALEIFFIEMFLCNNKKKYLFGLLLVSWILCNVHVAVWPFYFILFLPYLVEYIIAFICSKISEKNKINLFLNKKFVIEKNNQIKFLFIIMLCSLFTGLFTPIGDTPYTYLIKTMMGNTQSYILEHQMLTWIQSPFTIIIAFETLILVFLTKVKLRDLFMICGLVLMSIMSVRHLSLLALIGTICFSRVFATFFKNFRDDFDDKIINFFNKKKVYLSILFITIIFSSVMTYFQTKKEFIDHELYPVEAVNYIKENLDIENIRLYNEYNFGSYLILNDIPVFIDSRADLYTKEFSDFDYDIFNDNANIINNYMEKFEFYDITHALVIKDKKTFDDILRKDINYKVLYEDNYFVLFEKIGNHNIFISYGK